MATKTINVDMLAKMFLAGAQNIEAKKEYINELNVFPVPDGDTGTNMSLTIMAAAKEVTSAFFKTKSPAPNPPLPRFPAGRQRQFRRDPFSVIAWVYQVDPGGETD